MHRRAGAAHLVSGLHDLELQVEVAQTHHEVLVLPPGLVVDLLPLRSEGRQLAGKVHFQLLEALRVLTRQLLSSNNKK